METEMDGKKIGDCIPTVITVTESPRPSTADLDLTSLPARLDEETLEAVRAIANSPLPPLPPCDSQYFSQCLRMMLAVLPRRQADDIAGELFVAAYEQALGRYSKPQLEYMTRKAIEQHKWFPTVSECLEIARDWTRPPDAASERRALAQRLVSDEEAARESDAKAQEEKFFRDLREGNIPQETIDRLPFHVIREARSRMALEWDKEASKYRPPAPSPDGVKF